jgi:hypothetical protein
LRLYTSLSLSCIGYGCLGQDVQVCHHRLWILNGRSGIESSSKYTSRFSQSYGLIMNRTISVPNEKEVRHLPQHPDLCCITATSISRRSMHSLVSLYKYTHEHPSTRPEPVTTHNNTKHQTSTRNHKSSKSQTSQDPRRSKHRPPTLRKPRKVNVRRL